MALLIWPTTPGLIAVTESSIDSLAQECALSRVTGRRVAHRRPQGIGSTFSAGAFTSAMNLAVSATRSHTPVDCQP